MLEQSKSWFQKHILTYEWPLEIHLIGESEAYRLMTFLNLFKLLYPGGELKFLFKLFFLNIDILYPFCHPWTDQQRK